MYRPSWPSALSFMVLGLGLVLGTACASDPAAGTADAASPDVGVGSGDAGGPGDSGGGPRDTGQDPGDTAADQGAGRDGSPSDGSGPGPDALPLPDLSPADLGPPTDLQPPRDGGPDGAVPADLGPDPADLGPDPADLGPPPTFPGLHVVDPFLGTGAFGAGVGSALPGATRPFGMVKVSPDTRSANGSREGALHCAGYRYEDSLVEGFSHTHLHGTGVTDLGSVLLVPAHGWSPAKVDEDGYSLPLDHGSEEASPGYYAASVGDPPIRVELTATPRAALHRYTFPAGSDAHLILDLGHALGTDHTTGGRLRLDPEEGTLEGELVCHGGLSGRYGGLPVYASVRVEQPWRAAGVWQDGQVATDGVLEAAGDRVGAWLAFAVPADEELVLQVAVGISYIGVLEARRNREAELPGWDFEEVWAAAQQEWEEALGVVEVAGGTADQQTILYTSLYHALQMPTLFTDVDGRYRGFDGAVHEAVGHTYYTDFSLWDTYRNQHTLLTLLYPPRQRDMILSLIRMAEQGGGFPRWPMGIGYTGCMIGSSAEIVLADSFLRGIRDFDALAAFRGLQVTADGPRPPGARYDQREGLVACLAAGCCPADQVSGAVSRTLEYAYADFALAQLAAELGLAEEEARYRERASRYAGTWDPATRFFRGRHADGSFPERFDPLEWTSDFVEGDAWHYRFFVPWDVPGLAALFGSERLLVSALDIFFAQAATRPHNPVPDPYYWHGNEPDIHAAYLFAEAGRPAQTARWVRWILDTLYGTGPTGLVGNDDAGTLAAWYIFSALGFYPVPATDRFVVGSPLFPRARLRLPGGVLEIEAPGTSAGVWEVRETRIDGVPLPGSTFRHGQIVHGGRLEFEMVGSGE